MTVSIKSGKGCNQKQKCSLPTWGTIALYWSSPALHHQQTETVTAMNEEQAAEMLLCRYVPTMVAVTSHPAHPNIVLETIRTNNRLINPSSSTENK